MNVTIVFVPIRVLRITNLFVVILLISFVIIVYLIVISCIYIIESINFKVSANIVITIDK